MRSIYILPIFSYCLKSSMLITHFIPCAKCIFRCLQKCRAHGHIGHSNWEIPAINCGDLAVSSSLAWLSGEESASQWTCMSCGFDPGLKISWGGNGNLPAIFLGLKPDGQVSLVTTVHRFNKEPELWLRHWACTRFVSRATQQPRCQSWNEYKCLSMNSDCLFVKWLLIPLL